MPNIYILQYIAQDMDIDMMAYICLLNENIIINKKRSNIYEQKSELKKKKKI